MTQKNKIDKNKIDQAAKSKKKREITNTYHQK